MDYRSIEDVPLWSRRWTERGKSKLQSSLCLSRGGPDRNTFVASRHPRVATTVCVAACSRIVACVSCVRAQQGRGQGGSRDSRRVVVDGPRDDGTQAWINGFESIA